MSGRTESEQRPLQRPSRASIQVWVLRNDSWIACALVTAGLCLRAIDLRTHWLNPDEGIYWATAASSSWADFMRSVGDNAHPPLFYLIIRVVGSLSLDFGVLRAPALLFGGASIFGIYLLGKQAFGSATGLIAALLLTLSPAGIGLSQIIRPYTLQLTVLSFGLWFLLRHLEHRRRRDLVGYALMALISLLTQYGSVLFWMGVALWLVALAASRRLEGIARPLLVTHLLLGGVLLLLYVFHVRPHWEGDAASFSLTQWLGPFMHETIADLWLGLVGLHRYLFGLRHDGAGVILFMVGMAVAIRRTGSAFAALVLVSLGLASLLSLLHWYPFGGTRHCTYLIVLVIPLVAEALRAALSQSGIRGIACALSLLLLLMLPGVAQRAAGANRLHAGRQVEQIVEVGELRKRAVALEALKQRPVLLLLDRQTYFTLIPYFRATRAWTTTVGKPPVLHFRWGRSEVVVSDAWRLRAGATNWKATDHLVGFLLQLERELPLLRPRERGEAWLVVAGWAPTPLRALARFERRSSPSPSFLSEVRAGAGLGIARLDVSHLLRAFEASERPVSGVDPFAAGKPSPVPAALPSPTW